LRVFCEQKTLKMAWSKSFMFRPLNCHLAVLLLLELTTGRITVELSR